MQYDVCIEIRPFSLYAFRSILICPYRHMTNPYQKYGTTNGRYVCLISHEILRIQKSGRSIPEKKMADCLPLNSPPWFSSLPQNPAKREIIVINRYGLSVSKSSKSLDFFIYIFFTSRSTNSGNVNTYRFRQRNLPFAPENQVRRIPHFKSNLLVFRNKPSPFEFQINRRNHTLLRTQTRLLRTRMAIRSLKDILRNRPKSPIVLRV